MSTVAVASIGGVGEGEGVSVGSDGCVSPPKNDKSEGCVGVESEG